MMTRALPVLAFLSAVLLLPAAAGARPHLAAVDRGETVVTYEGDGETNIPMGYQCVAITMCTSFGSIAYTLHWEASVIVNRLGTIHSDDSTLDADGNISVQPEAGLPPGAPLPKANPCNNSVHDRRHYIGGVSVTRTRRSVGVQAELPFSLRWLTVSGDPTGCQMSGNTWAGSVFSQGLDSAPPQTDAQAAKLALALRPKMGAPKSAHRTTKKFDFTFVNDTGTGPYGIYTSKIRSTMTIFNDCKRLNITDGRCLSYYG
jgi:hypothetical protein